MAMQFDGLDDLIKRLDEAEQKLPDVKDKFLQQEGESLRGKAAELTPVRSGALRGKPGWKIGDSNDGKIVVYNNVEYAAHVEYGHRVKVHGKYTGKVVPGRHMLRDAVKEQEQYFQQDADEILKGLLE